MGDHEAFQFANILEATLEAGGWKVHGVNQSIMSNPISGLIISVKNDPVPNAAIELFHALRLAGMPAYGNMDAGMKEGHVALVVGSK